MKNYSEMSDFEINKAVALLCTIEGVIINDDGEPVRNVIDDSPGSYSGGDYIEHDFDPCNNQSDAWPIIVENKITIIACIDSWVACPAGSVIDGDTSEPMEMMYCNSWGSATCVAGKNPLRMAMIVFLMMKDAE